MKKGLLRKTVLSLLGSVLTLTASHSMEHRGLSPLHHTGLMMHAMIQGAEKTNSVHCAMGVDQTLALLHTIAESEIQSEIERFLANPNVFDVTAQLNKTLNEHSQPYVPESRWDDKSFSLNNGVYALFASQIRVNNSCDEKLAAIGAQRIDVNFSDAQGAANTLNGIVNRDTNGKIQEILSADAFNSDSVFVLLHTLYLNASWSGEAEESIHSFTNDQGQAKFVKSLVMEGSSFQFQQENGVTLISIPTVKDCNLIIRHSKTITDLQPITEEEVNKVQSLNASYVEELTAPFVSMAMEHNLKSMFAAELPNILQTSFRTQIVNVPIRIADYIQKVTFDMTNIGIEASSATAMHGVQESCCCYEEGPKININSPFTFVLTKTMEGKTYPLFHGQVVNHDVMK